MLQTFGGGEGRLVYGTEGNVNCVQLSVATGFTMYIILG